MTLSELAGIAYELDDGPIFARRIENTICLKGATITDFSGAISRAQQFGLVVQSDEVKQFSGGCGGYYINRVVILGEAI